MLAGFYVFHKKGSSPVESLPTSGPIYAFKTCLRQIYLAWYDESAQVPLPQGFDVYRGTQAYEFLLQVICGLHSPVVGETEVFGQFKTFWQSHEFYYPLRQILDAIIIDAKKVRGQHLKDLGGQSYGSLIRKMLKTPCDVAVIGSGAFVLDILPWIYKDENKIALYARNKDAAQEIQKKFEKLQVYGLQETTIHQQVVIVAAPLSSDEISALVTQKNALVIDLRGESANDPCVGFSNYKDLAMFFKTIEKNQFKITQAKALAMNQIGEMSLQRLNAESLRPFGWDDICVW